MTKNVWMENKRKPNKIKKKKDLKNRIGNKKKEKKKRGKNLRKRDE